MKQRSTGILPVTGKTRAGCPCSFLGFDILIVE